MKQRRRTVVFSPFGTILDRSTNPQGKLLRDRWDRWRPSLSLCQHDDFLPDRLELITQPSYAHSADALLDDIHATSPETEATRHDVFIKDPWDFAEVYAALRDFVDQYPFDEDEEDYYVHITTGTHVMQICLFLLAETRHLPARLIQTSPPPAETRRRKSGPGRYTIIDLDLSRYDQLAARFLEERQRGASFLKEGIGTRSHTFNALIDRIEQVASSSTDPILLSGATGTGKTRLARRIYELKKMAASSASVGPFVEVNCATLRGDTAMSTLFGHEKGAFTGAVAKREGLLQAANGGVLFLDEIGELGIDEQTMLLRALEDGIYTPLGSARAHKSQFQLIAGTNRDLYAAVAAGSFREDLLARIDLWSFELPRLAERFEDLEPNLDFELARHAKILGRKVSFNREARQHFLAFATAPSTTWNANFRDFGAAITRLVTLAGNERIGPDLVEEEIQRLQKSWRRLRKFDASATARNADIEILRQHLGTNAADMLDLFDRVQLAAVLRVCQQAPTLAAAGRHLFAQSRQRKATRNDSDRLKKYLARFDLDWTQIATRKIQASAPSNFGKLTS